jgi:heme/copper-type cytochrome/quinol oxidase subunit 2
MTGASAAILWVCAAGAGLVFGAMLYSIWAFPHKQLAGPASPRMREFVWALVPIAIVAAAAAPALRNVAPEATQRYAKRAVQDVVSTPAAPRSSHQELEVRTAAAHR